jgi:farnesyl-diphosphate farnesyltransferase
MGAGMAEYIRMDEVATVEQYDVYCHYVAGLVGIGLSQMWAASGLESSFFAKNEGLSNHMGLFLQKVNIIRDYLVGLRGHCPAHVC